MTSWGELPALIAEAGDPRGRDAQALLSRLLVEDPPDAEPTADQARAVAEPLMAVDRVWVAALGEDPDRSREDLERAAAVCEALRSAVSASTLPLRYARVELCAVLGRRAEAIEQLRTARLFSFGEPDAAATLTTARLHDDYSGVIRTTTAVPTRPDADPAGTALALAAGLLPHLARGGRVEAEDALMSLLLLEVPPSLRLRVLGDELEYLGLSGQWERGLALMRHSSGLADAGPATAWALLNAAVGASLVLREANRAGYGSNALGSTIGWRTPWGDLKVTGWDPVVRAYDAVTAFVRALAVRFDTRNGNNGVSFWAESRMAAESRSLASRSYGTVTGVVADRATLGNQGRLLAQVRELLVLANGYGLDSVHERALVTAETVSQSLAAVTDDSQLETVVDLRIAFCRLLLALSADERAQKEALDTTELCLSQGWSELAVASLTVAARAAARRRDARAEGDAWQRVRREAGDWGASRAGERAGVVVEAVGDPAAATQALAIIAEEVARGVEEDHGRASAAREFCKRARAQLERCRTAPRGVAERLTAVEAAVAPFGRGHGGRRSRGGATRRSERSGERAS